MSGSGLKEQAARQLEATYRSKDTVVQRPEGVRPLDLAWDDRACDVGREARHLCASMADAIGEEGAVLSIGTSSGLLAACERPKTRAWTAHEIGDAGRMADRAQSFDVIVCSQLVEDAEEAREVLAESFRPLQPGEFPRPSDAGRYRSSDARFMVSASKVVR